MATTKKNRYQTFCEGTPCSGKFKSEERARARAKKITKEVGIRHTVRAVA